MSKEVTNMKASIMKKCDNCERWLDERHIYRFESSHEFTSIYVSSKSITMILPKISWYCAKCYDRKESIRFILADFESRMEQSLLNTEKGNPRPTLYKLKKKGDF